MDLELLFKRQLENRVELRNSSANKRIEKLNKIHKWILSNRDKIKEALYKDFKKPPVETDLTEIFPIVTEIKHAKRNLKKWVKKKRANRTLSLITNSVYTRYESKGTVLIISPWNYPFLISIGPVISALSAGNSVILKPSEISEYTSTLLQTMFSELFPDDEIAVINGDKQIASELLSFPFDHIFFTGNTDVGKIVAKSASKNLTSITLELGGKSPVIIDNTSNLKSAAEKIVWGKYLNIGQTCIAPDYVLVERSIRKLFVSYLIEQIKNFYGNNKNEIAESKSYARIINGKHHDRLNAILDNAILNESEILYGGKFDKKNHFIEPTIVLTNCKNCSISEEEIFGPLLPIVEYETLEQAIDWINKRNPPLALYIFSRNKFNINKVIASTQSGGVGINEVVLQFGHQNLPFGGVKESGIGKSHGSAGFKEFSNERAYIKGGNLNLLKMIYPPYTKKKKKIIDLLIKYL